ncbi:MAG: HpaII family restriction endonuclease, partial [archaeon]
QTPRLVNDSIRESMGLLQSSGYNIVFRHIDSETFSNNISLIDSNLQKYLAKILLSYYTGEASKFVDLINYNFPVDVPQNIQPVHKIKEFVSNMALGMMPTKVWDGIVTSLGGLILVKRDGDVLFYYLYNLKEFREYLINNTKFETGSRRRHKFGKIFKKDGHYFIKLNLQVRFIK